MQSEGEWWVSAPIDSSVQPNEARAYGFKQASRVNDSIYIYTMYMRVIENDRASRKVRFKIVKTHKYPLDDEQTMVINPQEITLSYRTLDSI